MKTLIIVESPAKCKKIENYLGSELYKCVASFGHIRELTKNKGIHCIDINNSFKPSFQIVSRNLKHVNTLKTLIAKSNDVLLATDDDREGEAIAWHICEVCNLSIKTTKRILFHEITKTALKKAVANPTTLDMNKVYSQQARQVLDLLVGYSVSPMLWKYVSSYNKSSLSAGRCQTPALRIIYDNENEIQKNPGETSYEIKGYFTEKDIESVLHKTFIEQRHVEDFLEQSVIFNHDLSVSKPNLAIKKTPIPLTTSTIQQKASNIFGYSPKQTMRICQNLYEAGYITYMRTDSKLYSEDFILTIKQYISDKYDTSYLKYNYNSISLSSRQKENNKTKKENNAQQAHEAIRPTDITRETIQLKGDKITNKELRMYKFIWNHTLESCMSDAQLNKIICKISAPCNNYYTFQTEDIVFPGWLIVQGYQTNKDIYNYIKSITNTIGVKYNKIISIYSLRNKILHFTEAKLVSMLEKKGIGRPSTFSSIIAKIQERGYVKKEDIPGKKLQCIEHCLVKDELQEIETMKEIGGEKNKLLIQPIGTIVIEFLINHYKNIFDYEYTSTMENDLDTIAKGDKIWHTLCKECYNDVKEDERNLIKKLGDKMLFNEYKIDEKHTFKIARYGPIIIKEDGNKKIHLKVKKDITIEMVKSGTYTLEDIVEPKENSILGIYKNEDVELKDGKFGLYICWNNKNYSLKQLKKNKNEITLDDVIEYLENKNTSIKRIIDDYTSIRMGKYGLYVYYKTSTMKKPKFISLKTYKGNIEKDDIEIINNWLTPLLQ